jgi:hypothetical protein
MLPVEAVVIVMLFVPVLLRAIPCPARVSEEEDDKPFALLMEKFAIFKFVVEGYVLQVDGVGAYGEPLMLERLMLLVVILLDATKFVVETLPVGLGVRIILPPPLFAWISTLLLLPNAPIVIAFP